MGAGAGSRQYQGPPFQASLNNVRPNKVVLFPGTAGMPVARKGFSLGYIILGYAKGQCCCPGLICCPSWNSTSVRFALKWLPEQPPGQTCFPGEWRRGQNCSICFASCWGCSSQNFNLKRSRFRNCCIPSMSTIFYNAYWIPMFRERSVMPRLPIHLSRSDVLSCSPLATQHKISCLNMIAQTRSNKKALHMGNRS